MGRDKAEGPPESLTLIISEQGFLSFSNVTVASPQANALGCEPEAQINQGQYSLDLLLKCGAWRRLLRVPWTARRSNQSILKEINSEYSLEGLMLKLKLQYFGHLMRRANSLKKTDAGKD